MNDNSATDTVMQDLETYFINSCNIKKSVGGNIVSPLEFALSSGGFIGSNEIERALIFKWLEYAHLHGPLLSKSSDTVKQVLEELNSVFSRQPFLVKTHLTLADIMLFDTLWDVMKSLSFQEKETYKNLSRWFDTLQQDDRLRNSRKLIAFR